MENGEEKRIEKDKNVHDLLRLKRMISKQVKPHKPKKKDIYTLRKKKERKEISV